LPPHALTITAVAIISVATPARKLEIITSVSSE
jgi:hypothetical protein